MLKMNKAINETKCKLTIYFINLQVTQKWTDLYFSLNI